MRQCDYLIAHLGSDRHPRALAPISSRLSAISYLPCGTNPDYGEHIACSITCKATTPSCHDILPDYQYDRAVWAAWGAAYVANSLMGDDLTSPPLVPQPGRQRSFGLTYLHNFVVDTSNSTTFSRARKRSPRDRDGLGVLPVLLATNSHLHLMCGYLELTTSHRPRLCNTHLH